MEKGGYEVDDAWRFYRHPALFAPDSETRIVDNDQLTDGKGLKEMRIG